MASEEIPRVTDRFTNFAVFVEELDSVPEPARKIFEEYSGIAPDKVKDHIVEIRNRSFKIVRSLLPKRGILLPSLHLVKLRSRLSHPVFCYLVPVPMHRPLSLPQLCHQPLPRLR